MSFSCLKNCGKKKKTHTSKRTHIHTQTGTDTLKIVLLLSLALLSCLFGLINRFAGLTSTLLRLGLVWLGKGKRKRYNQRSPLRCAVLCSLVST